MNQDMVPSEAGISKEGDWYELDETGIIANRVPTWKEWADTGVKLATLHHALPMVIGDWVNIGEQTFGEKYEQVLDIFGEYEYGTVANYAHVMRKVPKERRLPGLTYSHYKAITNFEPDEQVELQEKALEDRMTSGEFWKYARGVTKKFPDYIDQISRDIAELYVHTTTVEQDEHLDEANKALMRAKENWQDEEERRRKAEIVAEEKSARERRQSAFM